MQIRSHIQGIGLPHSCEVFFFPTLPRKKILSGKFLEPEFWDNAQSESFCDVCWCWCNQSGLLERRLPLGIGNTKIGIGDEWGWKRNIEIIGHKRKCDHFPESKQKQLSLVHKTFQLNFYPIWNRNCFLSVLSKVWAWVKALCSVNQVNPTRWEEQGISGAGSISDRKQTMSCFLSLTVFSKVPFPCYHMLQKNPRFNNIRFDSYIRFDAWRPCMNKMKKYFFRTWWQSALQTQSNEESALE